MKKILGFLLGLALLTGCAESLALLGPSSTAITGGNIAQSIIKGLINSGYSPKNIFFVDRNDNNQKVLNDLYILKKNIYNELDVFLDYLKVDKQLKFYFEQSWIFKLEKESIVHKHLHENSLISGVYYIKLPNEVSEGDI